MGEVYIVLLVCTALVCMVVCTALVLDECQGAGEGESEPSGEQHWIDGVEFGGRVNKKEGGGH